MSDFKAKVVEALESILNLMRSTKEAYEGANRFARIRIRILGLFALDVLATLILVMTLGGRDIDVVVWFEPSFPSNLLMVRNESGEQLRNVTLTLDGRYRHEVRVLETGPNGYELNRDFRDAQELAPEDAYRPQQLQIVVDGDSYVLPVTTRSGG